MRYVIIRDDDTCALTPVECLETLYRPFLDRNLPVNLATIPNVKSDVFLPNGDPEGFLVAAKGVKPGLYPIGENDTLTEYLHENRNYKIVQHGCNHEFLAGRCEFDHDNRADIARRLERGLQHLIQAGFPRPSTFVAPYDRLTRVGYQEVARRFDVISTGWFELRRMPYKWWPGFALRRFRKKPHWRAGNTTLLSHPGCHLSYHRPYPSMLDEIKKSISSRRLTVLVTHWWEFFRTGEPDRPFIDILHQTADFLASDKEIKVISFADVADGGIDLN